MSNNDSPHEDCISLTMSEFVDRTLEAEHNWAEAEFRLRDAALSAHARLDDLRHEAGDAKIQKTDTDLERRLEEMNNFRDQINRERTEYLRREMYDREHASLAERVKNLEIVRGEQAGRTAAYASMVGVVVIMAQVVLHFWK